MNLIRCSCGKQAYYIDKKDKDDFKKAHKLHLRGKFKIYPSELLQIAANIHNEQYHDNEEPEPIS